MNGKHHTAFLRALKRNIKQWLRKNDWSRVQDGLAELKQLDPLGLETRGLELEFLLAADRRQEAGALANQLVSLFPASSRIHYLAGKLAYRKKDYARALPAFEESFRLHPHWRTERFIGKTYTQTGDFERAESLLHRLIAEHSVCLLDLAWLYERKQHYAKAQTAIEQYLAQSPDDTYARQRLQRLQAHVLPPDQVLEDVETLCEFDEHIPIGLLTEYIRTRLGRGEGGAVRQWLAVRMDNMEHKDALQLGWVCYQFKAYDLAFELFIKDFAGQYDNFKYRTALELSAERSGKLENLVTVYESYVEEDKRFYGRLLKLRKKLKKITG